MKKTAVLLAVAALFVVASLSSCTKTRVIVQYPNGEREYIKTSLYHVGDTVCVADYGSFDNQISESFWKDTVICYTWRDSSVNCSAFRMGVIIE